MYNELVKMIKVANIDKHRKIVDEYNSLEDQYKQGYSKDKTFNYTKEGMDLQNKIKAIRNDAENSKREIRKFEEGSTSGASTSNSKQTGFGSGGSKPIVTNMQDKQKQQAPQQASSPSEKETTIKTDIKVSGKGKVNAEAPNLRTDKPNVSNFEFKPQGGETPSKSYNFNFTSQGNAAPQTHTQKFNETINSFLGSRGKTNQNPNYNDPKYQPQYQSSNTTGSNIPKERLKWGYWEKGNQNTNTDTGSTSSANTSSTPNTNTSSGTGGNTNAGSNTSSGNQSQYGFKNFTRDVQGEWEKGVSSGAGKLKDYIRTSTQGMNQEKPWAKLLNSSVQDKGLIDKGAGVIGKYGLKAMGAAGAAATAKGAFSLAGKVLSNPATLMAAPIAAKVVGGFLKDKGMANAGDAISGSGRAIKDMFSKKASLEEYQLEGFTSIDDLVIEKKATNNLKGSAKLLSELGTTITPEGKEILLLNLADMNDKNSIQKVVDVALGTGAGMVTGIASNFATDKIRQNTGVGRPTIILTSGKKAEILQGDKESVNRLMTTSKAASVSTEGAKFTESALKRAMNSGNPISDLLALAAKASKKKPLATAFAAGLVADRFGPQIIDTTTRTLGSAYNFSNSQYNNLNYGYNSPYGMGYNNMYGGSGGYY